MNKILISLKKFFSNKNTVTIICVIGAIIVLYIGYNWRIKSITNPIRIPYAKETIQPRTKITESMIGYFEVPASMVVSNTLMYSNQIIGKYANYNTVIPEGSLFYRNVVVEWDDMPDSAFEDIPEGNTVVALPVDTESTLGNSIFPGNYIDLYYVANDEEQEGKLLLGKLISSIEVLSVKDKSGAFVFENSEELKEPAYLLFSVPENLHLLLRKALYLDGEIIPIQRNKDYSLSPGQTMVSSAYIQSYILNQTVQLPEYDLPVIEDTNNNEEE